MIGVHCWAGVLSAGDVTWFRRGELGNLLCWSSPWYLGKSCLPKQGYSASKSDHPSALPLQGVLSCHQLELYIDMGFLKGKSWTFCDPGPSSEMTHTQKALTIHPYKLWEVGLSKEGEIALNQLLVMCRAALRPVLSVKQGCREFWQTLCSRHFTHH